MIKIILGGILLVNSFGVLNAAETTNITTKAIEDVESFGINLDSFKDNYQIFEFINFVKTDDNSYLYFYSYNKIMDITEVGITSVKCYFDYNEDEYLYNDELITIDTTLVSKETYKNNYNFYKVKINSEKFNTTKRFNFFSVDVKFKYRGNNEELNFKIDKEYVYKNIGDTTPIKVVEKDVLKITDAKVVNRKLKESTNIFESIFPKNKTLGYIFFNTEIDHIIDRITKVTIDYQFKNSSWFGVQIELVEEIITNMGQDVIYEEKQVTIDENDDNVIVKKTNLFGRKVIEYKRLFEISKSEDQFIIENFSNYKTACMFFESGENGHLENDFVSKAKVFSLEYLKDGVIYSTSVVDVYRDGSEIKDDTGSGDKVIITNYWDSLKKEIDNLFNNAGITLKVIGMIGGVLIFIYIGNFVYRFIKSVKK